jgi:hypothetical protein
MAVCFHTKTKIRNHEIVVCCKCNAMLPREGRPYKHKSGKETMRSSIGKTYGSDR